MLNSIKCGSTGACVVALLLSACQRFPVYTNPSPDNFEIASVTVDVNGQAVTVTQAKVTRTFFQTTGAAPLVGRVFIDGDYDGPTRVVVLSEPLWRGSFGADPAVIGKQLRINGNDVTIVGIMPSRFEIPRSVNVWVPRGSEK